MIFKDAKFHTAKAIWIKNHEKEMNRTVIFEAKIPKGENTALHITAQNDYQLFINGSFVFQGPARAGHGFYRVDKLSIEKYLTRESNTVCVLVCGYHCNNFYLINQQAFLCAEFIDKNVVFSATGSDKWNAYLYTEKLQRVQRYAFQRPFCEVYDFSTTPPMNTSGKAPLEIVIYDISAFIEREVSYPRFPLEAKRRYIECGTVSITDTPKPFSPWWQAKVGTEYSGYLPKDTEFSSANEVSKLVLNKISDTPNGKINANHYLTAEMNCNITGLICTELKCNKDTTLFLTFDELLINGAVDYSRMDCINAVVYKLQGGKSYKLITAEPYTFKYINVISMGGDVLLNELSVIRTDFNDDEIIKRLSAKADTQIERIYNSAIETFKQNTYDIYMDCPSRERAGWLCDSFFTSRVEYLLSGKSTVEHSFLANFVMNDEYPLVPEGMLPMCYPSDHIDGNFIPNWAMWYVIELREYLNRTKDFDFVLSIKNRLYRLLNYFRGFENENGLLCKLKGWVFVEWSECNNLCQDINYPTNMLYYMFKSALGELYSDASLINEAEKLKEAINRESRIGLFFCDNAVLDENGQAKLSGKITETCQYYAFFCGITDRERDAELWSTLVSDFGSERKKHNKWPNIYFSNAFIGNYLRCELLKNAGLKEILEKDIRGFFDYMAKETGTLWEYDSPGASCNHGFASHVLIWLDFLGYIENK